ncbi:MAG: hypothetical protein SPF26_08010 [Succinivibrio sp.]|nr:hypothetical protein [Succinivibrio sp.]
MGVKNITVKAKLIFTYALLLIFSILSAVVVSINLFDTNSRVDDLYEELAVRNARTSKVADDLIKVDDLIFNLTQSGSMSRDQKTEL